MFCEFIQEVYRRFIIGLEIMVLTLLEYFKNIHQLKTSTLLYCDASARFLVDYVMSIETLLCKRSLNESLIVIIENCVNIEFLWWNFFNKGVLNLGFVVLYHLRFISTCADLIYCRFSKGIWVSVEWYRFCNPLILISNC